MSQFHPDRRPVRAASDVPPQAGAARDRDDAEDLPTELERSARRRSKARALSRLCILALLCGFVPPAVAQDEVEDVLRDMGTATAVDDDEAGEAEASTDAGLVIGRVYDGATGVAIPGVTVIITWPAKEPGGDARQEVQVTGPEGDFEFTGIPAGSYDVSFIKSGYRSSTMTNFTVEPGSENRADFPLPPLSLAGASDDVLDLDAFVVEASTASDLLGAMELRMESDVQMDVMSAEDLAKFSAGDVAEALKRVAGVNIVEGQFAIIRGLEDRYSSTLYNSAPVPSPDPDRQSVQLDLFPSEVVTDLAISKTFAPWLPANSSGGSIDVMTHGYPEEFTIKVKGGAGFNTNAIDRFLEFQQDSPVGNERDGTDTIEEEWGGMLGGRTEIGRRELRFIGLANYETDYKTAVGFQQTLEPRDSVLRRGRVIQPGDLAFGEMNLSAGRFDFTQSEWSEQLTGYVGLGIDLDEEGNHRIDGSFFYTRKDEEIVQNRENGYLPDFDYGPLIQKQIDDRSVTYSDFEDHATESSWIAGRGAVREFSEENASRGPLWFTNFTESKSADNRRDLLITQFNGAHEFTDAPGLGIDWATNYAKTTQKSQFWGLRYFYEPDDTSQIPLSFPMLAEDLGPGRYAANDRALLSSNDVDEVQGFGRLDVDYERSLAEWFAFDVRVGGWYEHATRSVGASYLESPTSGGLSQFALFGDTPEDLGGSYFEDLDQTVEGEVSGQRFSTNDSKREIGAFNANLKGTFLDDIDVMGGVRVENIFIESLNSPFTGEVAFMAPSTFPPAYLFFDRLDNPARGEVLRPPPPGTTFNDELLGIEVPIDPATGFVDLLTEQEILEFVNGEIDELKVLPAASITYRPLDGMALRGSYSQTVARPSFREMGFYVSPEPGEDDLFVGNPQLQLSDVWSADFRFEYFWGELGDLVALSGFYKEITDPIESIVIRNPLNFEQSSSALFRTFFNNPTTADLWGIEFEIRKSLDFIGLDFGKYVSIGGNFTWIEAEVDRLEIELPRASSFFLVPEGVEADYAGLDSSRRLFGQPRWIANADITFRHPDWGTSATLAWFGISDVLDAAGSVFIQANGQVVSYTPDRYVDSFNQLDLILSQRFNIPSIRGDFTFKFSAKNLTDSKRRILYDPSQTTGDIPERSFRVGRDFKFTLSYTFF